MSEWLLFDLAGALASFGGVAPGSVRDTELVPTRSALLGVLAAALGIERAQSDAQRELAEDLHFASRVNAAAKLQRDYHTAQAPRESALKGRPRQTRRDELSVSKDDLNTVLSNRFYYANYAATIAVSGPAAKLDALQAALLNPKFTLFLGRKSCPLGWPMRPVRLSAETLAAAFTLFDAQRQATLQRFKEFDRRFEPPLAQKNAEALAFSADISLSLEGFSGTARTLARWDDPLDTAKRLFRERAQYRWEQVTTAGAAP